MTVAIPDGLQPVWVGDCSTKAWDAIWSDRAYYDALIAWLRSEGFDEKLTYRVEVYLLDAPSARIHQYATDEAGEIKLNKAGDDVLTTVRTAVLSSLPPTREEA